MPRPCRATGAAEDMNPELVDARFSALDALGSAPDARASFLLRRQKKGAKEKATPALRGRRCRLPCATREAGRLRNSGFVLRQSSPTSPGRTPLLGAARGGWHTERNLERNVIQLAAAIRSVFNLPFASSSSAGRNGKKGEDCLRTEGPSSAALPLRLSSAEDPAQPGDAAGAPSSWLLLLGKTRRSTPARQARNRAPQPRQASTDHPE